MSALLRSERGRAGSILIVAGALLLAMATFMFVGQRSAEATFDHHPSCEGTMYEYSPGGGSPHVYVTPEGVSVTTIKLGVFFQLWRQVTAVTVPAGYTATVWTATGPLFEWIHAEVTSLPHTRILAIQHIDTCVVADAVEETTTTTEETTTTTEDTTTTTVAGPDETTTTAGDGTTTTVAGPGDPELPDTGAGQLLVAVFGGMGLVLAGGGSLVVARERRRLRF